MIQGTSSCFRRRGGRRSLAQQDFAVPVEAILSSHTWCEVLGVGPSSGSDATTQGRDLEAGFCEDQGVEDVSDSAVLEAFLRVGTAVHPFQNFHPDATLAFCWAVAAEQACVVSASEAQRIFAEVVTSTYDRLSLRNPEDCGLSKVGGDGLLRSLQMRPCW